MAYDEREWRVGELAEAAGLTVRALHHFDEIGLLSPARRSASGHRLYTAEDVRRLYRIVALRQLGLPLERIARSLDGEPQELGEAIARHMASVEAHLQQYQDMRRQLAALHEAVQRDGPSSDQLLDTIEAIMQQGHYFRADQLDRFKQRHEVVGIAAWMDTVATLASEADALAAAGVDPADDRAQRLAQRWAAAMAEVSGGDRSIVAALYGKLDAKGAPAASKGVLPQAAWDYLKRVLAVGFGEA